MSVIVVDVEADGPCPGLYSMISFGAVCIHEGRILPSTFYATLKPISNDWIPEALNVSGFTREQTMEFEDPVYAMDNFSVWIEENNKGRPMFHSDNNGFDWQFINYYFWMTLGMNPFGHSSTNIGSFYKGLSRSLKGNFKHLRRTKHTHHPVEDALGNAEAYIEMCKHFNVRF